MGAPLVKLRSVCHKAPGDYEPGDLIEFTNEDPAERDGHRRVVYVESFDWEDMGSPDTITVTVEPGDQLNPE